MHRARRNAGEVRATGSAQPSDAQPRKESSRLHLRRMRFARGRRLPATFRDSGCRVSSVRTRYEIERVMQRIAQGCHQQIKFRGKKIVVEPTITLVINLSSNLCASRAYLTSSTGPWLGVVRCNRLSKYYC